MPWKEETVEDQRGKFILKVKQRGYSVAEACRVHGISRPTGYKWIALYEAQGFKGLNNLHWSSPDLTTSTPRELFFKQLTELSADSNLFHSPDSGLQEMSAQESFPCSVFLDSFSRCYIALARHPNQPEVLRWFDRASFGKRRDKTRPGLYDSDVRKCRWSADDLP